MMKIDKIKVSNLFETFTHEIKFNNEIGITLILGQNGLGKTIVLKIVEFILGGNFHLLMEIQFDSIEVFFDNNIIWKIDRKVSIDDDIQLGIFLIQNQEIIDQIYFSEIDKGRSRLKNILRKYVPNSIRRLDEDEWFDRRTDEKFTTMELFYKYKHTLPKDLFGEFTIYPDWISSVVDFQQIAFIETQRLLTFFNVSDDFTTRRNSLYKNTVEEYSELLSKEINLQLANSSELATKLDRTYPNRLIERLKKTSNISQAQLNAKLNELEQKRERLQKVGLLDLEMEPNLKFIKEQDERIREVLLVYIEDSRKKLEIYDTIADKIELFLKIINDRFLQKRLSVSKEHGFYFESLKTKKQIPVTNLSSGEQHLLVLYYKLLFLIKKDTLLLMDEPEISLHISWQKQIIPDLLNILRLNPMNIVIATHSPAVIGKNWNLTVELNAQ